VNDQQKQRLRELLFFRYEAEGTSLFAVLDAARDPQVWKAMGDLGLERECLFSGRLTPALQAASPYLVRLVPGSFAFEKLLEQSWGQSWGIFLAARTSLREVRRHLRTFLQVQTEDRKKLLFRYYDPRVLRVFLPTCDADQLGQIFGPIQRFDMEAPQSSSLLRFRAVAEPGGPLTLRSWCYELSGTDLQVDDHGASVEPAPLI
jgi:hypothetical protein